MKHAHVFPLLFTKPTRCVESEQMKSMKIDGEIHKHHCIHLHCFHSNLCALNKSSTYSGIYHGHDTDFYSCPEPCVELCETYGKARCKFFKRGNTLSRIWHKIKELFTLLLP